MKKGYKSTIHLLLIIPLFLMSLVSAANTLGQDPKAMKVANAAISAMGGRENYNNTRYLSWLFFGSRFHVWDKYTGDIRIEYNKKNVLLMNIHTKKGRVWEDGVEITDTKLLAKKMKWGYETWINDSYWVVMPYKLHDDGVNLAYARQDKSLEGRPVDVLTMTFEGVGVTPNNKYEVFFDQETKLLTEFAYYPTFETNIPKFRLPWKNWKMYGNIKLSDNRGKRGMAPINVFKTLPKNVLTSNSHAKDMQGNIIAGSIFK